MQMSHYITVMHTCTCSLDQCAALAGGHCGGLLPEGSQATAGCYCDVDCFFHYDCCDDIILIDCPPGESSNCDDIILIDCPPGESSNCDDIILIDCPPGESSNCVVMDTPIPQDCTRCTGNDCNFVCKLIPNFVYIMIMNFAFFLLHLGIYSWSRTRSPPAREKR